MSEISWNSSARGHRRPRGHERATRSRDGEALELICEGTRETMRQRFWNLFERDYERLQC
eukprot:9249300-Karenia_brevis.AAC.1